MPHNIYEFMYQFFGLDLGVYEWYLMVTSCVICSLMIAAVTYGVIKENKEERGMANYGS